MQLNKEFRRRMWDINYWTFETDYFEQYPEFQGTAPKFEPQVAIYQVRSHTANYETALQAVNDDGTIRAALQRYTDSLAALKNAMDQQKMQRARTEHHDSMKSLKTAVRRNAERRRRGNHRHSIGRFHAASHESISA